TQVTAVEQLEAPPLNKEEGPPAHLRPPAPGSFASSHSPRVISTGSASTAPASSIRTTENLFDVGGEVIFKKISLSRRSCSCSREVEQVEVLGRASNNTLVGGTGGRRTTGCTHCSRRAPSQPSPFYSYSNELVAFSPGVKTKRGYKNFGEEHEHDDTRISGDLMMNLVQPDPVALSLGSQGPSTRLWHRLVASSEDVEREDIQLGTSTSSTSRTGTSTSRTSVDGVGVVKSIKRLPADQRARQDSDAGRRQDSDSDSARGSHLHPDDRDGLSASSEVLRDTFEDENSESGKSRNNTFESRNSFELDLATEGTAHDENELVGAPARGDECAGDEAENADNNILCWDHDHGEADYGPREDLFSCGGRSISRPHGGALRVSGEADEGGLNEGEQEDFPAYKIGDDRKKVVVAPSLLQRQRDAEARRAASAGGQSSYTNRSCDHHFSEEHQDQRRGDQEEEERGGSNAYNAATTTSAFSARFDGHGERPVAARESSEAGPAPQDERRLRRDAFSASDDHDQREHQHQEPPPQLRRFEVAGGTAYHVEQGTSVPPISITDMHAIATIPLYSQLEGPEVGAGAGPDAATPQLRIFAS
ncbi:unnamed protein product, partial [Amoebophrya sp. A25]